MINTSIDDMLIIDNAFGFEPEIEVPYKWQTLERFAKAGFTMLSVSMATDMTNLSNTIHYLAETSDYIKKQPEKYLLIQKPEDIFSAKQQGKLGISYMFQGSNPLEKNLALVDIFYTLGVRSLILSYNIRNAMGDGCVELSDAGLSHLGKKLIQRMNEVGMLIDCAHTSYRTSLEAIEHSQKPVIFSHSNVFNLHAHPRNLKDEQIKACAQSGGFIGINGNGPLLGDDSASIKTYVDHVEYIIQLVGDDYVGLGTDLVYFPEIFASFMQKNSSVYPINYGIKSIDQWRSVQPEQLPEITVELQNRGYTQSSIQKILGGNYLRVIKNTWK
jgi:membrane dipeptidase